MVDGVTGRPLSWEVLVGRAAASEVVLIGEVHGHGAGLALTGALVSDVLARKPRTAVLALEFLSREAQPVLDRYLSGSIGESDAKAADAELGALPEGHWALVRLARERGVAVVAANAPRRLVRLARHAGMEALRVALRGGPALAVAPAELTGGGYRSRFESVMREMMSSGSPHGGSSGEVGGGSGGGGDVVGLIEGLYRAQNVWDATMADSAARAASAHGGPVLLVVGRFHVERGGGLTERVSGSGRPTEPRRVLTVVIEPSWRRSLAAGESGLADAVVFVGESAG